MANKRIVDLTTADNVVSGDSFFIKQNGEPVWVTEDKIKSYVNAGIDSGTTDYTELTNKPQIGGVELSGNKTLDQLGIQPKIADVAADKIDISKQVEAPKVVAEQEVVAPKVTATTVEADNLYTNTEIDTKLNTKLNKNLGSSNSGKYLTVSSNGDVAFTGAPSTGGGTSDYNELTNIPTLDGKQIKGTLTLSTFGIASSSSVHNVPSGGTSGQVLAKVSNSNYDLEWKSLPTVITSYSDLSSKPQIGGVELSGNKTLSQLGAASLASPTFTGTVSAPTPSTSDNSTKVATTAYVKAQGYVTSGSVHNIPSGGTTGQVLAKSSTTDYDVEWIAPTSGTTNYNDLNNKPQINSVSLSGNKSLSDLGIAPLASPSFTGSPTSITPSSSDNSTKIATTAYVKTNLDSYVTKSQGSYNSGKFLSVGSNGYVTLVNAPSGNSGEITLLKNTGLSSWSQNSTINVSNLSDYDLIGISCICNTNNSPEEIAPIQWFKLDGSSSTTYALHSVSYDHEVMVLETQARLITVNKFSGVITSKTKGFFYSWYGSGNDDRHAVPRYIYGLKL